jgi:hypothetical protein
MPNTLTIAFLAGALAFAGFPATALDLPDYGSKNFSPSSDTPTYFANETAPVSARTADTTAKDWSAVDDGVRSATIASAPSRTHAGKHGRHASAQRSGKYGLGKSRSANHGAHSAKSGSARTAAASPARTASTRGTTKGASASSAKTTTAKHGKTGARQARAAVTYPVATSGGKPLPEA